MAAAARPARQRRAPQQLYDLEARGMGFRHDSEADQAARAAGRGQQAKDEPGAAARGSSGSAGRSHAQRSTPAASGRATRRNTTLPDHGPLPMGIGTNVGPEPRSRAAGAQFDTPERYEMLMRFRLWRQATKAGMAHHESLDDICADFNTSRQQLRALDTRETERGTLRTRARSGRPVEWTEEAQQEMEAETRENCAA